jgi:hypothetical protein
VFILNNRNSKQISDIPILNSAKETVESINNETVQQQNLIMIVRNSKLSCEILENKIN